MDLGEILVRSLSVLEVLALGFVCLVFVVFLRAVSRFPTELDRIGADISLYACGAAFSLFGAAFLEQEALKGASNQAALFLGSTGILLSIMSYFATLFCSEELRRAPGSTMISGIDNWQHLVEVLDNEATCKYFKASVTLGLLPGVLYFFLDIARSFVK